MPPMLKSFQLCTDDCEISIYFPARSGIFQNISLFHCEGLMSTSFSGNTNSIHWFILASLAHPMHCLIHDLTSDFASPFYSFQIHSQKCQN